MTAGASQVTGHRATAMHGERATNRIRDRVVEHGTGIPIGQRYVGDPEATRVRVRVRVMSRHPLTLYIAWQESLDQDKMRQWYGLKKGGKSFTKAAARAKGDEGLDTGPGPGKYEVEQVWNKRWKVPQKTMKWQRSPHVNRCQC